MKRIHSVRDLREDVLQVLGKYPQPIQLFDLAKALRIKSDSDDYEYLRHILVVLSEEGLVIRHSRRRFGLRAKSDNPEGNDSPTGIEGVLEIQHHNAVVNTSDPSTPVVHIRRQHMLTALDGDKVLVIPHGISDAKRVRGEIVAVLERSGDRISGTVEYDGSFFYVIPDDAKHYVDFLVAERNLHGARAGDKVICSFMRWEHQTASPEVEINEIVGKSGSASVEFEAIMREFRLPANFPDDVMKEADLCPVPPRTLPKDREDLRRELIITIDPVDARDFDDALSLRHLPNGNVELGVHIADVTHYVKEGTALDNEARKRGNSTYLVNGVVPMLPERLSNNLCSLVPDENRMAFSVFMEFTRKGIRTNYRIAETMIRSKRRYSYEEVQNIINTGKGDNTQLLLDLHTLSKTLFDKRMENGGIDFETSEVKFILDEHQMPVEAVVKTKTDATSLVEECMLAANRTVAEHLHILKKTWKTKSLPPFVYRIHEDPEPDRLADAVAVVRALGYNVPDSEIKPRTINHILQTAHGKPEHPVVNQLLLRSMSKAVYAEHNIGHYGLGFKDYSHFTSPIRRYPDLFIHRVLKEYALGKPAANRWQSLLRQAGDVSDHSTQTERASVEAERASIKLAQTILAREHLGEDFIGEVTGVTNFGVFITIRSLHVEGLLHMRDLFDDFYYFDEKRFRMVGRNSGRIFMFGTQVPIRIVRADVKKRTIDFHLQRSEDDQPHKHRHLDSHAPHKADGHREKRSGSRGKRGSAKPSGDKHGSAKPPSSKGSSSKSPTAKQPAAKQAAKKLGPPSRKKKH